MKVCFMRSIARLLDQKVKAAIGLWAESIGCRYVPDDGLLVQWLRNNRHGDLFVEPLEIRLESANAITTTN